MAFAAILIWLGPPLLVWFLFGQAGLPVALAWFWFFAIFKFFAERGRPEDVARRQMKKQQRREAKARADAHGSRQVPTTSSSTSELTDDEDWGPVQPHWDDEPESEEGTNFLAEIKYCGQCGASFDNDDDKYCGGCGCPRWLEY